MDDMDISFKIGKLCLSWVNISSSCPGPRVGGGGGDFHIKVTGLIVGNFETLKGTRILFCGHGPNNFFFP